VRAAQTLPLAQAYRVADRLAGAFFHASGTRRNYGLVNVRIAYPDLSERDRRDLLRSSYGHLARNLVDLARSERWTHDRFLDHVSFQGVEHTDRAFERGLGVLALIPHLGNFELVKRAAPIAKFPLSVVMRPFNNRKLYAQFEAEDERTGVIAIPHRGGTFQIIRTLRQNRAVAVLNDQYVRRGHGVWAPLFGTRCSTSPGVALLALRTGTSVIPCFAVRDGFDHHTFCFEPPIEPPASGDVMEFTAAHNATLERIIRRHPEQWLWMHRRFRHSPDLDGDPYA
jgi:Kdo2-lipid IVA lauroyltransferase/acyltransferase